MSEPSTAKVGVVICCHGDMGAGLLDAAEMILGPQGQATIVGVYPGNGIGELTATVTRAAEEVDRGAGVLVLTDLSGGTPSNVVISLHRGMQIEAVAGVNLPAILRAFKLREETTDLSELAADVAAYGRRHIAPLPSLTEGND